MANKKSILKHTFCNGFFSIISKILGIIKDILRIRYMGVGVESDAFSAAYKIPNILKKPLAGGALSVAFIPTLVKLFKENKYEESDKIITGILLINSFIATIICLLVFVFPKAFIFISAGGFFNKPVELAISVKLIKILIFFIFFNSITSILSGAMQAKLYFIATGLSPIVLNIIYIVVFLVSTYLDLNVYNFTLFLLLGASSQLLFFLCFFIKTGFRFRFPDAQACIYIKEIFLKFLPCILSISSMKINTLIDERFGSTLSSGTYTIIDISSKFMTIILHIIGSNFASILLPSFSAISVHSKRKLNLYIFQAIQLVFWLIMPISLIIIFFSYDLIYAIFYKFSGDKFTLINVKQAATLVIGYSSGLIFYSINKILLNSYYSLNIMSIPAIAVSLGIFFNIIFNYLLIDKYGIFGISIATSLAALMQTILFLVILKLKLKFSLHIKRIVLFSLRYSVQLSFFSFLFYLIYKTIFCLINNYFQGWLKFFLLHDLGLWIWVGPLILFLFILLYKTRRMFGIKIYFLS